MAVARIAADGMTLEMPEQNKSKKPAPARSGNTNKPMQHDKSMDKDMQEKRGSNQGANTGNRGGSK